MPKSALPERLQDPANWAGTDDDVWYMRWRMHVKGWFAYGPRAIQHWAKWREWPVTLFAIRSRQGAFRVETETWEPESSWDCAYYETVIVDDELWAQRDLSQWMVESAQGYLSRVQYYTRWSFQIQWPFMVAFHFYSKKEDVPEWGVPRPDTDGKLWFFYFGAHRDADKVYWFPSAYLGRNWK